MNDTSPAALWAKHFVHRQARDVEELRKIFKRHIEEENRIAEQQKHEKPATVTAPPPTTAAATTSLSCRSANGTRTVRTPHMASNDTSSFRAGGTVPTAFLCYAPQRGTIPSLTLPFSSLCFVHISVHVNAGHFFVQMPTHSSFASLAFLNQCMLRVYTMPGGGAPGLVKPCGVGVLCAAPAYNGWFRAITLAYDQDQDEMLVRFVDYGGFARLPRADLRQIRTDFVTLPLQAIECYLANVQPADGLHWSDKANELFQQLCVSKIIQAALVGYCKNDGIPCVELFVMDNANKKTVRVDQILLERGLAKPMEL